MNNLSARALRQLKEVVKQLEIAANGIDISDLENEDISIEQLAEAYREFHAKLSSRASDALPTLEVALWAAENGIPLDSLVDYSDIEQARKWKKQAKTG